MSKESKELLKLAHTFVADHNKTRDTRLLQEFDKIVDGIADSCFNNREFLLRIGCLLIIRAYEVKS
jgi:hypothetical protein